MNNWITAKEARAITEGAPLKKLNAVKEDIARVIRWHAERGRNRALLEMKCYEISCPEDWWNIYNWLLKLGYDIEDNSGNKRSPHLYVNW